MKKQAEKIKELKKIGFSTTSKRLQQGGGFHYIMEKNGNKIRVTQAGAMKRI